MRFISYSDALLDGEGLAGAMRDAIEKAKDKDPDATVIEMEGRFRPDGEGESQSFHQSLKLDNLDPEAITHAVTIGYGRDPGPEFNGSIRVWWRLPAGAGRSSSERYLGSYQRKVSVGGGGGYDYDEGAESVAEAGDMAIMRKSNATLLHNLSHLHGGMLRMVDHNVKLTQANAALGSLLLQSLRPPVAAATQDGNSLIGLLGSAMQAGMAGGPKAAAAGAAAHVIQQAAAAPSLSPAASPALLVDGQAAAEPEPMPDAEEGAPAQAPGAPPPPRDFTSEDAAQWARANPDEARALAFQLMQEMS